MRHRDRTIAAAALTGICLLTVAILAPVTPRAAAVPRDQPPVTLSDVDFWRMVTNFSEVGGSFPSNNFVSNEIAFQTVIPRLKSALTPGGIYLGVGPDQNFTYLAALKPRLAFIVDIRRQNLLQQLLYKALIERAPSRIEFLSRLFSRPRPPELGDDASIESMLLAFDDEQPAEELFEKNFKEVREQLAERHKFNLSDNDWQTMRFVYRAFFEQGPGLTYEGGQVRMISGSARGGVGTFSLVSSVFPSYAELMIQTDGRGTNQAYLANQDRYEALRDLELRNVIVPIVGDFAGDKAIRAIATYLKQSATAGTVTAVYTSNVEQYLFQNGVWRAYYENVATLPLDASSTFIRSFFPSQTVRMPFSVDSSMTGVRPGTIGSSTLLCPIKELLDAVGRDTVHSYLDVIAMSK